MFRDILEEFVEEVGPIALKVIAAVAGAIVFAPLLAALLAPTFE